MSHCAPLQPGSNSAAFQRRAEASGRLFRCRGYWRRLPSLSTQAPPPLEAQVDRGIGSGDLPSPTPSAEKGSARLTPAFYQIRLNVDERHLLREIGSIEHHIEEKPQR
jgi:hypothetical protein